MLNNKRKCVIHEIMNNTLFVNVSFCVLGVTMTETSALVEILYELKSFFIQTARVDYL